MSGQHSIGTVLVVDDDEDMADLYAEFLADRHDVDVAYDGEEALDRLRERAYDVALLDRRMPDLSGDDVLVTLRDWGLDVAVALVTGAEPERERDLLDRGFEEYLVKPVSRETLRATVGELVETASQDALWRELSALRVQKNILEVETPDQELPSNEEYQEIAARVAELEERLPDSEIDESRTQSRPVEP